MWQRYVWRKWTLNIRNKPELLIVALKRQIMAMTYFRVYYEHW